MAIFPNGSRATWAPSLKALLASTLVISAAVLLKLSLPAIAGLVPSLHALLLPWLRPPYLYILVNCIIISIVASSRLHRRGADDGGGDGDGDGRLAPGVAAAVYAATPAEAAVRAPAEDLKAPEVARVGYGGYGDGYGGRLVEVVGGGAYGAGALEEAEADEEVVVAVDGGDEPVVPEPASPLRRNDSSDFSFLSPNEDRREKPPVSTRFGHRKPAKSSPEVGRQLRVSRPKRNDTLESTWRTITDGRAMPLARHLRKSDTWDSHGRRNDENSPPPPPPKMKKSETFATRPGPTNRPASPSPGSGRLRRDPSLGQDDLNRRVEAFIRKFNEQMRLQRQESLNQLQEMINRGAG
ncbi:uncharacterized protein LOC115687633 [Syzygium oleosum]|uniref:uncharacterized protein LOC115687633 n=1 Tax=Syzygium oleosum TaxID=219896 RepID=UPI0024BB2B31|nr:uncharacterized protein LOC115687633 [Syzygium oleosum]